MLKTNSIDDIVPNGPLWKYLSLEDDMNPSWQDRVLQLCIKGMAYCSSPRQFNDPFDCLPQVLSPQTDKEKSIGTPDFIKKIQKAYPTKSIQEITIALNNGLLKLDPASLSEHFRESAANTVESMGIFCLSQCIDNILMWSHYANNHRGIALRINWNKQYRHQKKPIFKVLYDDERPKISFFGNDDAVEFADALRIKAEFWSYEQEWRVIEPYGAGKFLNFNPNMITGIVFGINCSNEKRQKVMSLLTARDLEYFEAYSSPDKFEIKIRNL